MSSRSPRFPAKFPIVVRHGPDMYPATICNINSRGGCIVGTHRFSIGDSLVLDYNVGQTRAFVIWTMAKMVGLQFENELSAVGLHNIRDYKVSA